MTNVLYLVFLRLNSLYAEKLESGASSIGINDPEFFPNGLDEEVHQGISWESFQLQVSLKVAT